MESKLINIFGGPGVGKSTIAHGLMYEMKRQDFSVAMAPEWIKQNVYEGRDLVKHDQIYVFAKQRWEIQRLWGKVAWVITDSPLLLSLIYRTEDIPESFDSLVRAVHHRTPSVNFHVIRTLDDYNSEGRYHTELSARIIDRRIKNMLRIEIPTLPIEISPYTTTSEIIRAISE